MKPLRVTAQLLTGPAGIAPFMLDGILLYGEAARVAVGRPGGLIAEEEAIALPLPLARVELPDGRWWWACSGAVPVGDLERTQERTHVNRRPDYERLLRLTTAKSVDALTGPDKQLRNPRYSFPFWRRLEWTCVGDREAVEQALAYVPGVGQGVPQGEGWVLAGGWTVAEDPGAPGLDAYRTNARLRPLPADVAAMPAVRYVDRVAMPLRAPYWSRVGLESCWKISEVPS